MDKANKIDFYIVQFIIGFIYGSIRYFSEVIFWVCCAIAIVLALYVYFIKGRSFLSGIGKYNGGSFSWKFALSNIITLILGFESAPFIIGVIRDSIAQ